MRLLLTEFVPGVGKKLDIVEVDSLHGIQLMAKRVAMQPTPLVLKKYGVSPSSDD